MSVSVAREKRPKVCNVSANAHFVSLEPGATEEMIANRIGFGTLTIWDKKLPCISLRGKFNGDTIKYTSVKGLYLQGTNSFNFSYSGDVTFKIEESAYECVMTLTLLDGGRVTHPIFQQVQEVSRPSAEQFMRGGPSNVNSQQVQTIVSTVSQGSLKISVKTQEKTGAPSFSGLTYTSTAKKYPLEYLLYENGRYKETKEMDGTMSATISTVYLDGQTKNKVQIGDFVCNDVTINKSIRRPYKHIFYNTTNTKDKIEVSSYVEDSKIIIFLVERTCPNGCNLTYKGGQFSLDTFRSPERKSAKDGISPLSLQIKDKICTISDFSDLFKSNLDLAIANKAGFKPYTCVSTEGSYGIDYIDGVNQNELREKEAREADERHRKEQEEQAKRKQAEYAEQQKPLIAKYGANYVETIKKAEICVGMPVQLLIDVQKNNGIHDSRGRQNWAILEEIYEGSSLKEYSFEVGRGAMIHYRGHLWVKKATGKISDITIHGGKNPLWIE